VEATPYLRLLRGLSQWTRCDTRNATPLNHCGPKTFSLPPPSPIPSPHPRFSGKRLTRSKKRWIYKGPQAGLGPAFRGFFSFAIRGRIAFELRLMLLPGSALSTQGLCAISGKSLKANCREVSDWSFLRRHMDHRCISLSHLNLSAFASLFFVQVKYLEKKNTFLYFTYPYSYEHEFLIKKKYI